MTVRKLNNLELRTQDLGICQRPVQTPSTRPLYRGRTHQRKAAAVSGGDVKKRKKNRRTDTSAEVEACHHVMCGIQWGPVCWKDIGISISDGFSGSWFCDGLNYSIQGKASVTSTGQ